MAYYNITASEAEARRLDVEDPLGSIRDEFYYPDRIDGKKCTYLCGNSLGLLPKRAKRYVDEELKKWSEVGVEGHFRGERPWVSIDEKNCELLCDIVGARYSSEIVVMNTLSTNLHLLMAAFYKPTRSRYKILIEGQAFCSDHHIVRSQIAFHNLREEDALIQIEPRPGEYLVNHEDIYRAIDEHGSEIALILIGGMQYLSGQLFDMKTITERGHAQGCLVAFDLAHAVGNVRLRLHDWNVDFAVWCTYKYLNAGAGAIAGGFVHSKHDCSKLKKFKGWWGQTPDTRFKMKRQHNELIGAQAFQLSNPAILPCVCLQASLEIFKKAGGMARLREKSVKLTGYLEALLRKRCSRNFIQITSTNPNDRGNQLSLFFEEGVDGVKQWLESHGVIVDERRPNIIRVSPAPLYNSYSDVWRFVDVLHQYFNKKSLL